MPHQRPGAPITPGESMVPTSVAAIHASAPENGSCTYSEAPDCGSSCLSGGYAGARPTNNDESASAQSGTSATVATQPTLRSSGGAPRSAGGQPGGGGPDGPTDSASTQA